MKNLIYLFVFSLPLFLSAQINVDWHYSYGEGRVCNHITTDGGSILVGEVYKDEDNLIDVRVIKTDSSGVLEWEYTYGGTLNDVGESVLETEDGGFMIAGSTFSNDGDVTGNQGSSDFWVVKLNSSGILQWQKNYGGSNEDAAYDILNAVDGGFLLVGYTKSTDGDVTGNQGESDVWVVKIDDNGTIQWQKTYGGTNNDKAYRAVSVGGNAYVLTGDSYSNDGDLTGNHGSADVWILKIDNAGNLQWQKNYGGSNYETATAIHDTSDGGVIITGNSASNDGDFNENHGSTDVLALKMDSEGAIEWSKLLGGFEDEGGKDVIETSDGNYVFAGYSRSNNGDLTEYFGTYTAWIFKLNSNGNLIWQKSFGNAIPSFAFSIVETSPDQFLTSGDYTGNSWLMNFHYENLSVEDQGNFNLKVYPNPTQDFLEIAAHQTIQSVKVMNFQGKIVFHQFYHDKNVRIDFQNLPAGVYLLNIQFKDEIRAVKVLKK